MAYQKFLKKYNLSEKSLDQAEITWDELQAIRQQYEVLAPTLRGTMKAVAERLVEVSDVHSVRSRMKDPEHLMAKIVRKRLKNPERVINIDNLSTEVEDLAGVRVLHLFKSDWRNIHNFITETWDTTSRPVANIRQGDPEEFEKSFRSAECDIHFHESGYRSVHYTIKSSPSRMECLVEIQVRTIFEEAWSEIDHRLRYPHNAGDPILEPFLVLFNRFAGSADEMGAFILLLKSSIQEMEAKHNNALSERDKIISGLRTQVSESVSSKSKQKSILDDIDSLGKIDTSAISLAFQSVSNIKIPDYYKILEDNFNTSSIKYKRPISLLHFIESNPIQAPDLKADAPDSKAGTTENDNIEDI